jgi:hypothetical protein
MPFETTISDFAAALANPFAAAPTGAVGRLALPDSRRFSVYRNNVAIGLIAALEARYPISRRIVGDAVFRAMARNFAHARKPRSPVIIAYGDDFPEFISNAAEELDLPYLVDVARLENAWVEAYHAGEAKVAVIDDLLSLSSDELPGARIELHPAARLLRLATPAASIWSAHQVDFEPCPPECWQGEDALVVRPEADVSVHILPPDGYTFAARLRDGATFAEAAEALSNPDAFGAHVVSLVGAGAVVSIIPASLTRNIR